jgi:molecular chaperone GrpE
MTEACEPFNRDRVADAQPAIDAAASAEEGEEEGVSTCPEPQQEAATREAYEVEFENYRRRVLKEMDEREARTRETIFLDFLEVADNLERAIAAWKKGGAKSLTLVKDGIDSVLRLFRSKLERYAVTAIEAEGEPFDPRLHHAVSQSFSAEAIPGTVLQEVQKGYRMDGRLLRPAAVVVAAAPGPATEVVASDDAGGSGGESGGDWHGYQRNRR